MESTSTLLIVPSPLLIYKLVSVLLTKYPLTNQQVQTDRTIPNNKPDIIIRGNEKGACMLIDVANSGDTNVIKK